MSEAEDRKRYRSPSAADDIQDKEKQMREFSPEAPAPGVTHVSVMKATDLQTEQSPVSTKTPHPINLLERCKEIGIDGSPPNQGTVGSPPTNGDTDLQQLYGLFTQLEDRVTKQEGALTELKNMVSEKDDQIFNLRKDNAFLQKQISDVRADSLNVSMAPTINFSQELAVTNEGLAKSEATINTLSEEVRELTEIKKRLDDKYKMNIRRLHLENDRLQQYTMRDSIKICGVPYKAGEDTNTLVTRIAYSLGVSISEHDISVSHRTGRIQGSNPRPIVAKFTRRATKHAILYNKSYAKNITTDDDGNAVKIYVDEQITPLRGKFCKRLREKKIKYNTRDGKIISGEGAERLVIDFPEDWERLDMTVSEKEELGIFPKW